MDNPLRSRSRLAFVALAAALAVAAAPAAERAAPPASATVVDAPLACAEGDIGTLTKDEVVSTDPVVRHVRVRSHDCTELDGWLILPAEAATEPVPAVLWSGPYFGQCNYYPFPTPEPKCDYPTGDDPELRNNDRISKAVPIDVLLEHGYAVPVFNVRGTGNSGGCFSWFGRDEQLDQAFLVEWLADQAWSNGNIGMMGLSYHGTTPWEAAIQNPPSLKTIVVAGTITDAYTFSHTPQGATMTITGAGVFPNNFVTRVSLTPPVAGDAEHATVDHATVVPERACPDLARYMTEDTIGMVSDLRDQAFWDERRLIDHFPEVEAAVFVTHGLQDLWLSGHQSQENAIWDALEKAPKRMLLGQWGHEFPNFNSFRPEWAMEDWNQRLVDWLDHWLKDTDPDGPNQPGPREGLVDYQDSTGAWRTATSWPPAAPFRDEVLYLAEGGLRTKPASAEESASFRAVPQVEKLAQPEQLMCEASLAGAIDTPGLQFLSEPVPTATTIAGNPVAHLRLSSDLPGGLVAVHLFDVGPEFSCASGVAKDITKIATGAADLRFHSGNFVGRDFPAGEPTAVRIDITNPAHVLAPGHRLGLAVSSGDPLERTAQPWYPTITVHADGGREASHLVLPTDRAGFGGRGPTLDYPPRPFLPR